MGKMTSIMNMALMIGAVSAFENKQFISDRERKERREDMDLKNSKSEKEKAEMQGHKEFDFNGHKIYALNQKNADKKARKLGLFFPEKDEDILKQVSSSDYFTNYYDYSENECKHPKEQRTFIGSNLLRCGVCGEEFS